MPNWCQNTLTVSGDTGDLLVFAKANAGSIAPSKKGGSKPCGLIGQIDTSVDLKTLVEMLNLHPQPLCMNRAIATPPSLLKGDGWYEWRHTNWGTKWNMSFSELSVAFAAESLKLDHGRYPVPMQLEGMSLIYTFDTAWSPPEPYVDFVAHKYSALKFVLEYAERGMDFAGRMTRHVGQGISDHIELEISDVLGEDSFYY